MATNLHHAETKGSDEKFDDLNTGFRDVHSVPTGESNTPHLSGPDEGYDPSIIKAIRRKIDWRLVPPLSALYAISLIDRTNISLAAQAGMNQELVLSPPFGPYDYYRYAVIAFFPPYIAFELFSNIGLRRVGARWWLPTACMLWSVVLIGMAFVQGWQALVALRALLGVFEAALFPGATYLMSCWYLRRELAWRLTSFYMVGVFFSGLSALLAYGFAQIETGPTLYRWRWIFFGEGLLSVAIAIPCYFLIVDFPSSHRCTFLTEEEKTIVATRIQRDRGDAAFDGLSLAKVGKYAMDLKLWAFSLCFCFSTMGSYALSYFAPLIIGAMGFRGRDVYLLVFPPYVAALPWGLALAFYSDKTGRRLIFIVINALVAILGCCLFTFLPAGNVAGRYIGIFLTCASVNSNVPLVSSASQSAIRGQSKRSFTSALVVGFGGIGGILSGVVFRTRDAPRYILGMSVVLGAQGLTVIICGLLAIWFLRSNSLANQGKKVIEGHPDFRYQI